MTHQTVVEVRPLEDLNVLVSLAKMRGFVFPGSEIYGGLNSIWDYGPLGAQLKLNVKLSWWQTLTRRLDIVGLDAAILMHPGVWKASGHVDHFTDPLVDCLECKHRFRPDVTPSYREHQQCPKCGSKRLSSPRQFNLLFRTHFGPVEDEASIVYLRPETAQGHYVNFQNIQQSMRLKLPFGIAAIGKSFRNEITPGHFIFRMREFEQMEMQYFVKPGTDEKWFHYWKTQRWNYLKALGLSEDHLRFMEHQPHELAHYAKQAGDIQYRFPMGWSELEGIHNRGQFDLTQHQNHSGKSLEYFDEETHSKYIPVVIETAIGCDRLILALLCEAYRQEIMEKPDGTRDVRVVLGLNPLIAPVKVAVLPLMKKPELVKVARGLALNLAQKWEVQYDETASIGKRYRRQDEIGTPFCVTVDYQTLQDQTVTVRDRDTMQQERVAIRDLDPYFQRQFKLGSLVLVETIEDFEA